MNFVRTRQVHNKLMAGPGCTYNYRWDAIMHLYRPLAPLSPFQVSRALAPERQAPQYYGATTVQPDQARCGGEYLFTRVFRPPSDFALPMIHPILLFFFASLLIMKSASDRCRLQRISKVQPHTDITPWQYQKRSSWLVMST